jgi:large subunit ribosomal protein L4
METKVYSVTGSEKGTLTLPEAVFGVTWNADLVHEVVVGMQANARQSTANVKDRSEVRGGGKKPWKQKGTGRARHGSRRSPIWAGGGIAHGPTSEKDYSKKINKKVRAKALATVLSKKFEDGEMLFVEALTYAAPKTADAVKMLGAVSTSATKKNLLAKKKNAALVILPKRDSAVEKSFANVSNVTVMMAKDVNPVELLTAKYVVVAGAEESVATLVSRVTARSKATAE